MDPTVGDLAQWKDEGHALVLLFLDVQFRYVRAGALKLSVLVPGTG